MENIENELKKELNMSKTDLFSYMNNDPYNYSAILSGVPGSGVAFLSKYEIAKTYFNTDDDIIVFDYENELSILENFLDTKVINLGYPSKYHINPLDIIEDTDPYEQFDRKTILFKAFYEIIVNRPCTDMKEYGIKKALASIYKENKEPKLIDLYNILEKDSNTKDFADALLIYSTGNNELLSRKTNIEYKRLTIFDTKQLHKQEKTLFTLAALDSIYKKINENLKQGKKTWIFIDEITNLLDSKNINPYLANTWKTARLLGVKIIGITRNLTDMLTDESVRPILINTYSLELLNQTATDRNILRNLYNLSDSDLDCITFSDSGNGLLCIGPKRIPFKCSIQKEDKFYKKANGMEM